MASEYVLRIPLDRHVITTQRSLAAVLEDIRRVLHDSASRSALQGHLVAAGHQVRLIIDRPEATDELVRCLPDAGAYCPATVLVQAAGDGACLAYDSVASAISPYQDEEALAVAELFDAEVLSLLRRVAEPAPGESGQ
ncbi:hypothetical protein ABIA31_008142 [Catenulispora sp. MAP5-51]|uniref:hypothetical protein n=1 Tax=Catenulispora sp. MAP5-51 TaxID=3156298 RepID=UPI003513FB31